MKIRTRLLLFLLPTLICSIALVSTLLSYNWYQEIVEGFRTRIKSAVITTAMMHPNEEELKTIRDRLQVTDLYTVSLNAPDIETIPKTLHITPIYKSKDGKIVTNKKRDLIKLK